MASIKVVSFDLDGTITDISFADSVWLEGIPRLYALKNRVSLEDAKRKVKTEYDKVGREKLEWYDPSYWIKKFGLSVSTEEVLRPFEDKIRVFAEVLKALKELKHRGFKLIILTNARREFVDAELGKLEIRGYFEHIFSSTSDFGLLKKTTNLYEKVCDACGISPSEMIHVGDDHYFDFEVPRKLGILAFYLDRTGKNTGEFVVHNLQELNNKLSFFCAHA
jgi:putative hydrolase of the HAD superfamily